MHRDSLCCAKPPSDMIGSWITVRSPRSGGRDVSYALEKITQAYEKNRNLENLLFDEFFIQKIESSLLAWRQVVAEGALHGVALPAMSSGLSYFDGLSTPHSAANLIQAQRDYFGAHTYERVDWERGKFFHANWTGEGGKTVSGTYNV